MDSKLFIKILTEKQVRIDSYIKKNNIDIRTFQRRINEINTTLSQLSSRIPKIKNSKNICQFERFCTFEIFNEEQLFIIKEILAFSISHLQLEDLNIIDDFFTQLESFQPNILKNITLIRQAIKEDKKIEFQHTSRKTTRTNPKVIGIPYYLTFKAGRFYCLLIEEKGRKKICKVYLVNSIENIRLISPRKKIEKNPSLKEEDFLKLFFGEDISLIISYSDKLRYVTDPYPKSIVLKGKGGKDSNYLLLKAPDGYPLKRWILSQSNNLKILSSNEVQQLENILFEFKNLKEINNYDKVYYDYVQFIKSSCKNININYDI